MGFWNPHHHGGIKAKRQLHHASRCARHNPAHKRGCNIVGMTFEFGVERFVRQLPSTSVEACLTTHYVFAKDNKKWPSGYNGNVGVTEIRIGANYYFDMGRLKRKSTDLPPTSKK